MANTKEETQVTVIMRQSLSGPKTIAHAGEPYTCGAAEAKRLVDAGFARAETAAA